MAAHQAPPSLGFSRQEHWSGLPFPSPMHESEKWKWSHSVMSSSSRRHGLQPTRLLRPWDFPGKSTGVGCHCLLQWMTVVVPNGACQVVVKNPPAYAGDIRMWVQSMGWEDPWRRAWQSTPVFLPGESHGQRSLAGYSPQGHSQTQLKRRSMHVVVPHRAAVSFIGKCYMGSINT